MVYTPQTWVDGVSVATAARMQYIESGVVSRAARIRRKDQVDLRLAFPFVHPDPPQVVTSSMNAATSVTSPVVIDIGSTPSKVRVEGGQNLTTSGTASTTDYVPTVVTTGFYRNPVGTEFNYVAFRFLTDSKFFEITYQASTSPTFQLFIDGLPWTADLISLTNGGGGTFRLQVTLPSRRVRDFRLDCTTLFPAQLVVSRTDTVYAPAKPPIRAAFLADSFTWGGQTNWAGTMCRILGWDPILDGTGGCGYTVAGTSNTLINRLSSVTALNPDVFIVAAGINDGTAGLATACSTLYSAISAALPYVPLIVFGPWAPNTASATSQATKASIIQTAAEAAGATFIPVAGWLNGSGDATTPDGTGNSDFYTLADDIHPTVDGQIYLGTRAAQAVAAAIEGA